MSSQQDVANPDVHIKCVVIGDGAVGKTCLLFVYSTNSFPADYVPTVFDNYSTDVLVDEKMVRLALWDTAGQEDYDRLRPLCYPGTHVFILCFSLVQYTSYENAKTKWYEEIKHNDMTSVPIVLVGTKSDLREDQAAMEKAREEGKRIVTDEEAEALRRELHAVKYFPCSAKTQKNVKPIFDCVISTVLNPPKPETKASPANKKKCVIF